MPGLSDNEKKLFKTGVAGSETETLNTEARINQA